MPPPTDQIYFPVGLAVGRDSSRLYVASSDFDLQYTGGVVQAFDLNRVRSLVPIPCRSDADCSSDGAGRTLCDSKQQGARAPSYWCAKPVVPEPVDGPVADVPCGAWSELSPSQRADVPVRCGYVDIVKPQDNGSPLLVDAVQIGAFASDLIYRDRPKTEAGKQDAGGKEILAGRLFVPVRGDATLHFIDVDADDPDRTPSNFRLACGQDGARGHCSSAFRVGDDPDAESSRDDLRMPPEPYGLDATADGSVLVVTHQVQGSASLFVNHWATTPRLEYVATGLPDRVVGVAAVPIPKVAVVRQNAARAQSQVEGADEQAQNFASAKVYAPGFLLTFGGSPIVQLDRYMADSGPGHDTDPARPYLLSAGGALITQNSLGTDSRGVAVDASRRQDCEAACDQTSESCLATCAAIPLGVYVANRSPNSLLIGQTAPPDAKHPIEDVPYFFDSIPLPLQVSRVVVGKIIDLDGTVATRVFVVSFEERKLAIYNPESRMIEKLVSTGRGPHAFALDVNPLREGPKALGYLGHFTDSWVGVVDLDRRHSLTYGTIVLTVGQPRAPRGTM